MDLPFKLATNYNVVLRDFGNDILNLFSEPLHNKHFELQLDLRIFEVLRRGRVMGHIRGASICLLARLLVANTNFVHNIYC